MKIVVLISGNGSNLQALIDAAQKGAPFCIQQVISNRPDAHGLVRAQNAGIPFSAINHSVYKNRQDFEEALIQQINEQPCDLIVLAGFMRLLSAHFVNHYKNRILNIHPSLLPKYPGLRTHERVLAAQETWHGVSIHLVTEALDEGPLLAQARCRVEPSDTIESLQRKIHQLEHELYPATLSRIAKGELIL